MTYLIIACKTGAAPFFLPEGGVGRRGLSTQNRRWFMNNGFCRVRRIRLHLAGKWKKGLKGP